MNNPLDKVYLSKANLENIANGGSITSGDDTYTGDENALYLVPDEIGDLVQTTGQSTTDVMSQKAVTDAINSIGAKTYYTLTIDTPIPTKQPILATDTVLNSEFVTGWCYYFVSANDGVSTHYKLRKNRRTQSTVIDQIFDMNGAGMTGIDAEIEFTYISEDRTSFTIRQAGARVDYIAPTGKKIVGATLWIVGDYDYFAGDAFLNTALTKGKYRSENNENLIKLGFVPIISYVAGNDVNAFTMYNMARWEVEENDEMFYIKVCRYINYRDDADTLSGGLKQPNTKTYVRQYQARYDNGYRPLLNGSKIVFELEDI